MRVGDHLYLNGEPVTVTHIQSWHVYYIRGHHSFGCADKELFCSDE